MTLRLASRRLNLADGGIDDHDIGSPGRTPAAPRRSAGSLRPATRRRRRAALASIGCRNHRDRPSSISVELRSRPFGTDAPTVTTADRTAAGAAHTGSARNSLPSWGAGSPGQVWAKAIPISEVRCSMPPLQAHGLVAIESATEPHLQGCATGQAGAHTIGVRRHCLAVRHGRRIRLVPNGGESRDGSGPLRGRRGAARTIRLSSASVGGRGCGEWRGVLGSGR